MRFQACTPEVGELGCKHRVMVRPVGDPGHYAGRVEQDEQEIIHQVVESNRTTDDRDIMNMLVGACLHPRSKAEAEHMKMSRTSFWVQRVAIKQVCT